MRGLVVAYIDRSMKTRPYSDEDYETVCRWWAEHGWNPVPREFLPVGVIVDGVAAGFLYEAKGVAYGMAEWIVANPENTAKESFHGVDAVLRLRIEIPRYISGLIVYPPLPI